VTWPVGTGRDFLGCYHLLKRELVLLDRAERAIATRGLTLNLDHPGIVDHLPARAVEQLRAQVEMALGSVHRSHSKATAKAT